MAAEGVDRGATGMGRAVEVFVDGESQGTLTNDTGDPNRWTFDYPAQSATKDTIHRVRFEVTANNTLTHSVTSRFYFPSADAPSLEESGTGWSFATEGTGVAERSTTAEEGGWSLVVDADNASKGRATWTKEIPNARVTVNATVNVTRLDEGARLDLIEVLADGDTRTAVFLDNSTQLRIDGPSPDPINTSRHVRIDERIVLRVALSPGAADLYLGPRFVGSFPLNATGAGFTNLSFGGTGAKVRWDAIQVRSLEHGFSTLQFADFVNETRPWTTVGDGNLSTVNRTGTAVRVEGSSSDFAAFHPNVTGGRWARYNLDLRIADPHGTPTTVAGLQTDAGLPIVNVTVEDGTLTVSDGAHPNGTPRDRKVMNVTVTDRWQRLDVVHLRNRALVGLNQSTWVQVRTHRNASVGQLMTGKALAEGLLGTDLDPLGSGVPEAVELDRIVSLNDGLDFDNVFDIKEIPERGWNKTREFSNGTDATNTSAQVEVRALNALDDGSDTTAEGKATVTGEALEVNSPNDKDLFAFAASPKRHLGDTYIVDARFRPAVGNDSDQVAWDESRVRDQSVLAGLEDVTGGFEVNWTLTMDSFNATESPDLESGWAVYWISPNGSKTRISDPFHEANWHHVRIAINETGEHVKISLDEDPVFEAVDLPFGRTARLGVGDVFEDADPYRSGRGKGFYGEVTAMPAALPDVPPCAGTCPNPDPIIRAP